MDRLIRLVDKNGDYKPITLVISELYEIWNNLNESEKWTFVYNIIKPYIESEDIK